MQSMYLPVLLPRSRIRQCHVSQRGQLDLGCGVTTNLRSGGCKTLPICSTTRIRAVWPSYQWSCSAGPPPPNRQGERAVASPLDDVGGSVAPSLRLLVYSPPTDRYSCRAEPHGHAVTRSVCCCCCSCWPVIAQLSASSCQLPYSTVGLSRLRHYSPSRRLRYRTISTGSTWQHNCSTAALQHCSAAAVVAFQQQPPRQQQHRSRQKALLRQTPPCPCCCCWARARRARTCSERPTPTQPLVALRTRSAPGRVRA
jgi:hypothetical protein